MKYFILLLSLMLSLISYDVQAGINSYMVHTSVNIRECGSTKCKVIGSLPKGKTIKGELRPNGWVKVSVKQNNSNETLTGYVIKTALTESKTSPQTGDGISLWPFIIVVLVVLLIKYRPNSETLKKWEQEAKDNEAKLAKPIREYYRNGQLYREGKAYRNKKYGLWKQYDKKGNLEYELQFYNDTLNGITKGYDKLGNLVSEVPYVNGVASGIAKTYYKHGAVEFEAIYVDGKLNGIEKNYDKVGRLIRERIFDNDQVINVKIYNINGKIETEASYLDGLLDGKTVNYDKDGNITCVSSYERGVLKYVENFDKNGHPLTKATYKAGIYDGDVITHDSDTIMVGHFEKGDLKSIEVAQTSISGNKEATSGNKTKKSTTVTKTKKNKRRLEL